MIWRLDSTRATGSICWTTSSGARSAVEIRCLVSFPVGTRFAEPALVSLQTALYLAERGWLLVRDPQDERDADIQAVYWKDVNRRS